MAKLAYPQTNPNLLVHIGSFTGADLTNAPSYVDMQRSPECPNMIRESAGKVRKWIGWHTVRQFDGRINGFHSFRSAGGTVRLVHAGTKLVDYNTGRVYSDALADSRSVSRQLDGRLIIADGSRMLSFSQVDGGYRVKELMQDAFVPVVTISRNPDGGGTTYQPVNLIGSARTDSFLGTATDTVYQLSATQITGVHKVEILTADGSYTQMAESGYTADNATGRVTFATPPGKSVLEGHDNVRITYGKFSQEYADRINHCSIMTVYGVDGLMDRLFVAGNPQYPNRDYWCAMDQPDYWPDIAYSVLGQDKSRIMGYSVINSTLATHLDKSDTDTNIILRRGEADKEGNATFRITDAYQGTGTVSPYAFAVLETEPLFLTEHGIMAVTPSDVLGERYAQLRSYYLNGLLLKQNLEEATACTYDRFYMLAAGGYIFALDGTQSSVEENQPYSRRQYAAFYRTGVPARIIANIDETLTFGTDDGRVCRFYKDYSDITCFNDDGRPIPARWTTPELSGRHFYYKKRFRLIAAMLGSAIATGVQVKARYDGIEETVVDYSNELRYFAFSRMQFSKTTFKTDRTAQIIREKVSVKPDDRKVQFVFENDIINEPFAIYDATVEYTESR